MARQLAGFETWSIPQAVPLPRPPTLVKFCQAEESEDLGKNALQDLQPGDLLHITGGTVDGKVLYGVKAAIASDSSAKPYKHSSQGWVSRSSVQLASPSEVASSGHLRLRDHIDRVTLMQAINDWEPQEDSDFPDSLCLQNGELLQLGAIRDTWAYGWSLRHPDRKGWFPVSLARRLDPVASSLVGVEMDEELCPSAANALVELIRRAPQPTTNAQKITCPTELPSVVAESARRSQSQWEDKFAQMDRDAQEAATMAQREADGTTQTHAGIEDLFSPDILNEDAYPLYVCKSRFHPPHRRGEAPDKALLTIQNGDLIRVVSALEATMYCGFLEGRPNMKGWFPRRCVEQLEDPLMTETDVVPVGQFGIGVPLLPEIPHFLRSRS